MLLQRWRLVPGGPAAVIQSQLLHLIITLIIEENILRCVRALVLLLQWTFRQVEMSFFT